MDKLFPKMRECPETKYIFGGAGYWIVYQLVLPFLVTLGAAGTEVTTSSMVGAHVAYLLLNLVGVGLIFWPYLKESFWMVRLEPNRCLKSAGLGLAVLVVLEAVMIVLGAACGDPTLFFGLPAVDRPMGIPPVVLLFMEFDLMRLLFIFLSPVTMCCLYYAVGFAAPAQERPWLGYLTVALMAVIPAVLVYTSGFGELSYAASFYVSMLPVHMCSCWVYQRSDTIWAPVLFQVFANMAAIPVSFVLLFVSAVMQIS